MIVKHIFIVCLIIAGFATIAVAQNSFYNPKARSVAINSHVYNPQKIIPADQQIGSLKLPAGFKVNVFARNLGKPRVIKVSDSNHIYVSDREAGKVTLISDTDGDGVAENFKVVAQRPKLHGIAIAETKMYLITVNDVYVTDIAKDGSLGELKRIIKDLPDGGQHQNRTVEIGPDKQLYISCGSTANATDETSPESATLVRSTPDGISRTIYASGLRNTIGFDWQPDTAALWGMDHGIDWLGDNDQKEELNKIEDKKNYGWPYVFEDGKFTPNRQPPGELKKEEWKAISSPPVLTYTAHAAPMQLQFYKGSMFPSEYKNDAFVTMHGSWNRKPPSGYEVVRIHFENNQPVSIKPFITGFLLKDGKEFSYFGRPMGLATLADGSLLIGDDSNGIIYRISYLAPKTAKN
jgi:glucose/arabinose dehydrogenase